MTPGQVHATNVTHGWINLPVATIYQNWLDDPTLADHLPPPPLPGSITDESGLCDFIASIWKP